MAFNFFKKNKEGVPPDVGREESEELGETFSDVGNSDEEDTSEEVTSHIKSKKNNSRIIKRSPNFNRESQNFNDEKNSLELQKANARLDSLNEMIKGYGERISSVNQQIGELRAMSLTNEKAIGKIEAQSVKAVDLVNEVRPEKLRIEYQKIDLKVEELRGHLDDNKQFMETIMNEIKDIRKKIGTFIGTEELLRLNEDIKKDLLEAQQVVSKSRVYADKTEQLFAETRRGFAESEKVNGKVNALDANYSGLQSQVQKLKLDFSKIISKDDFNDLKKEFDKRITLIQSETNDVGTIKEENERLGRVIETILSIEEQNKDDIADIALTIGKDNVKKVSDYDERLSSILEILDSLAGQIAQIKNKVGLKKERISVKPATKKIISNDKVKLQNIDIHPKMSKKLAGNTEKQNDSLDKIADMKDKSIAKSIDGISKTGKDKN